MFLIFVIGVSGAANGATEISEPEDIKFFICLFVLFCFVSIILFFVFLFCCLLLFSDHRLMKLL